MKKVDAIPARPSTIVKVGSTLFRDKMNVADRNTVLEHFQHMCALDTTESFWIHPCDEFHTGFECFH